MLSFFIAPLTFSESALYTKPEIRGGLGTKGETPFLIPVDLRQDGSRGK